MEEPKASASPAEPLPEESASSEMPDSFDESFISGMVTTMELGRRQPPIPPTNSQVEAQPSPNRVPPQVKQSSTTTNENLTSDVKDRDRKETEDFFDDSPVADQSKNQSEVALGDAAAANRRPPTAATRRPPEPAVGLALPSESSAVRAAKQSPADQLGPLDNALRPGSVAQRAASSATYSPQQLAAVSQQVTAPRPKKSRKLMTFLRAAGYAAVTFLALVGMAALGYAMAVSDVFG